VVVIGGGLAGLAAAEALAAAATVRHVSLVEASGRPGGVIATFRGDGWLVERSADSFLAARPEGMELVTRLGLGPQLVGIAPAVRRALIWHGGRAVAAPAGFRLIAPGRVGGILTTPLLSLGGRLRVLAERCVPPRRPPPDDESLASFAGRRLGRQAFERLVQPLAAGIWTADPQRLSMAAACPDFLAMERTHGSLWAGERARLRQAPAGAAAGARYGQFVTLAAGMETLPTRLAAALADRGVAFVPAVAGAIARDTAGRWRIPLTAAPLPALADGGTRLPAQDARHADLENPRCGPASVQWTEAGEGCVHGHLEADAVVVAAPAPAAARIVADLHAPLAADLTAIEYAGSAVVSLGFPRAAVAHPLDAAGMVVPRAAGRRALAVSFSSSKFPGRAPPGCVLVRVFVGGALDPHTAALPDGELAALARAEVAILIGATGEPLLVQIDRWQGAMPQYHVGHLDRVARIEAAARAIGGFALAGAAYRGVGIPQVIASGQAAAAAVLGVARPPDGG
jgi:oxygen-dependent protoporphyrinogen oxidase